MKHPISALNYAQNIIKGRWPEAEPYMKEDVYIWDNYKDFLSHLD
jgi:hypothetical protein